jgi:nucleoside-diphosphate-sugar epimerase
MRVFVTGASGYVGHSVARAFRSRGHVVYGLVRSDDDAQLLSLHEIWPVMGDLNNPESYGKILAEVEVVVHCAMDASEKREELDAKTIEAVLGAFASSSLPKAFIYTSGVWVYGSTGLQIVDEASQLNPIDLVKWRPAHEEKVLKGSSASLRTVVLRPGCVYGGVGGLTNLFFTSVHDGSVSIIGEGSNRLAMIHVEDLAHAYVGAAEKELSQVVLNVVDDSGFTLREMAEAIAHSAGIPGKVTSFSAEEADKHFGPVAQGLSIDQAVSNSRIKRLLGWQIHHLPFIHEMDLYYNAWEAAQEVKEF